MRQNNSIDGQALEMQDDFLSDEFVDETVEVADSADEEEQSGEVVNTAPDSSEVAEKVKTKQFQGEANKEATTKHDAIINQWFAISKQKLTHDDPMVTMMLMFDELLSDKRKSEHKHWKNTLLELDKERNNLNKTIARLSNHKEEIIYELDAVNRRNVSAFASGVEDTVKRNEEEIAKVKLQNTFLLGVICINLILIVGTYFR